MALVGEAHILIRAVTKDVAKDIERGIRGTEGVVSAAGRSAGRKFSNAFRGSQGNFFSKISAGLKAIAPEAEAARSAWARLQKTGFVLQTAISTLVGSIGALIGGLGALAGAIGGALPAALALVGAFVQMGIAVGLAKFALGGVGAAARQLSEGGASAARSLKNEMRAVEDAQRNLQRVAQDNAKRLTDANKRIADAQQRLNEAIREGREEIQQMAFDAEDAALSEKRAALELEKARENLLRVQDLPPNSRARREAELAFAEAELNLRRAIDANNDLAAAQAQIGGDVNNLESVIDAEADLADAIDNRDEVQQENAERLEDANRALERALEDLADAQKNTGAAGVNAFKNLTASQADFARFLATLKPLMMELKEAVASGFLPVLEEQIKRIINSAFPTLKQGFTEVGIGLGEFVTALTDAIVDPANIERLGGVFTATGENLSLAGKIAGDAWEIFLILMEELDPLIRNFLEFISGKTGAFKDFLNIEQESGALTDFFTRSSELAGDLGEIMGNIFEGIGAIIEANFGPGTGGDMMLKWLISATEGFAKMGEGAGMEDLQEFFRGSAANAISIFQALGGFIGGIIALGADPNIKIFWDTLAQAAPFVNSIATNGLKAAPALATLLVEIARIVAAFADAVAPETFFTILGEAAKVLADILSNEVVQAILGFIAPITGTLLAFGTLAKTASFAGKVIAGIFAPVAGLFKFIGVAITKGPVMALKIFAKAGSFVAKFFLGLFNILKSLIGIIFTVGRAIAAAFVANPVGAIIAAIVAVISALVWFFTQTELGKELWAGFVGFLTDLWNNLVSFFTDLWNSIVEIFTPVFEFIGGLFKTYIDIWIGIIKFFIDGFAALWNGIVDFFTPVIDNIVAVITTAFDIIRGIVEVFIAIFTIIFVVILNVVEAVWNGIVAAFEAMVEFLTPILEGLFNFFKDVFTNLGNFIGDIWDAVVSAFQAVANFLKPILDNIYSFFSTIFTNIGNFVGGIWKNIENGFKSFINFIKPAIDSIYGFFQTVFNNVSNFVKGVINTMIGFAEGFVNFFVDALNGVIKAINSLKIPIPEFARGLFGGAAELSFNIAPVQKIKLSRLAEGGIVRATPGGVLAQIAEGGRNERVEPLDSQGLSARDRALIETLTANKTGGATISMVINPSPGMDERELATAISRQLAIQFRKGAIA